MHCSSYSVNLNLNPFMAEDSGDKLTGRPRPDTSTAELLLTYAYISGQGAVLDNVDINDRHKPWRKVSLTSATWWLKRWLLLRDYVVYLCLPQRLDVL